MCFNETDKSGVIAGPGESICGDDEVVWIAGLAVELFGIVRERFVVVSWPAASAIDQGRRRCR
jgi:hypothetical protein